MFDLPTLWFHLQRRLFPSLGEELGPLTDDDQCFIQVMVLLPLEGHFERYAWCGNGRPPYARIKLFHAFVAKSVYGFPDTDALIQALHSQGRLRQLCGWDSVSQLPSAPTFSRAFAEFAQDQLPQRIHAATVQAHAHAKLVGHVSRDATAIAVAERPAPKPAPDGAIVRAPRKRGRPKKGEERPAPPPTRLQQQSHRSLGENLADLPQACDSGCKLGSRGQPEYWQGYKLHLDVIDGDIPVSALLTSASLHDSQAAIPLMQMTAQRVTWLYDLMDAAYDAQAIHDYARRLGHVPLIEPVQRGDWVPLDPAERRRFGERSASERVNSRLKEQFGGRTVRVRGAAKVMAHLMYGLLAITALSLWQRLC